MKHIKESKDNNFIIVVPTNNYVRITITTYYSASKRLGSIIEFTLGALLDNYRLFINEANFLLQHPALIKMTSEFYYAELFSATQRICSHKSIKKDTLPKKAVWY